MAIVCSAAVRARLLIAVRRPHLCRRVRDCSLWRSQGGDVGDGIAAERERIDDECRAELGVSALDELGRRSVDRARDSCHRVAAVREHLRVRGRLKEERRSHRAPWRPE